MIAERLPSAGAINYRVSRQISGVNNDPVEIGLGAETEKIIGDLPVGAIVTIFVTARNDAGETLPTQKDIVVP